MATCLWLCGGSGHRWGLVVNPNVLEAERKRNMKTYCKRLVVSDADRIYDVITDYMHDKYRKNSSVRFFACYTGESREHVKQYLKPQLTNLEPVDRKEFAALSIGNLPENDFWRAAHYKLALEMAYHIRTRTVREHLLANTYGQPLIRYTKINDPGSGKERMLGLETILFRLYEQVAAKAAEPLFKAKLGTYQCASIKGRGQNYGKKAVMRWLSNDVEGTRYSAKADVKKCYPSIRHGKLLELLKRDLHKSDELLYLFTVFIELYEEWPSPEALAPDRGILIGSPVSKDLCNYFLSYAYHYASERLVKITCRRGQTKIKRLIAHVIFYMDDITMYAANKTHLKQAVKMMIAYMLEFLDLRIKPDWIMQKTMYEDQVGKTKGAILDFMGFRFHGGDAETKSYFGRQKKHKKVWVTIRRNIFLTARQKMNKFLKLVKHHVAVRIKFVRSVISAYGWFKNTNMVKYRIRNKVDELMRIARKIASDHDKGNGYVEEKYFNMWRRYYAQGSKSRKNGKGSVQGKTEWRSRCVAQEQPA